MALVGVSAKENASVVVGVLAKRMGPDVFRFGVEELVATTSRGAITKDNEQQQ